MLEKLLKGLANLILSIMKMYILFLKKKMNTMRVCM